MVCFLLLWKCFLLHDGIQCHLVRIFGGFQDAHHIHALFRVHVFAFLWYAFGYWVRGSTYIFVVRTHNLWNHQGRLKKYGVDVFNLIIMFSRTDGRHPGRCRLFSSTNRVTFVSLRNAENCDSAQPAYVECFKNPSGSRIKVCFVFTSSHEN